MRNSLFIAARELRSLFLSPLAWSILGVVQFIHGYLYMGRLEGFLEIQARLNLVDNPPGLTEIVAVPVFATASIVLLLVTPLLSMRLISEERRNRSLSLLFSAPLSMTEIILGKYLGLLGFMSIMSLMLLLMPLSLLGSANLDLGLLFSAWLAVWLLSAAFSAAGLFMSTLTQYPTVAAVGSFGLLLLLWIVDWAGASVSEDGGPNLLAYVSILNHYNSLLRGVLNSTDIAYYLLFIATFLILSIRRLDADRLQG